MSIEVPLDFQRTWLEIPLAENAEPDGTPNEVLRADITWLTSSWNCIFGRGCAGIYADRPDDGCCTLGAHFTGREDVDRVRGAVQNLQPEQWQRNEYRANDNWLEEDTDDAGEPEFTTRRVDGACVFLNDADFPGGGGCAFHHAALEAGREPLELKPDVCWQLPIRRSYRTVERLDGTSYLETSISEFDRRAWGSGGRDLAWYCSGNPEAHTAAVPVFIGMEAELRELVGNEAYELLAAACNEAMGARRLLPLTVIQHPATERAEENAKPNSGGPQTGESRDVSGNL